MVEKRVFVTVGTTKFEQLIQTVSSKEVLNRLQKLGYTFVQFQTGSGKHEEQSHDIALAYKTYFENFDEEIQKADLVISHAGAGSCLQVLKNRKPLIVVINDDLMDNHQVELAEQLQNDGYLYYGTCDTLHNILTKDFSILREYPTPQPKTFKSYLDRCMGFAD